jgi:purine-binding chemotaxis protein CheW
MVAGSVVTRRFRSVSAFGQVWDSESEGVAMGFSPGGHAVGGADSWMMLCRVGGGLCALPVRQVVEVMRPMPIEPLPGGPPFVVGAAVIRGAPVPVVDAGLLLRDERWEASRFVALRVDRSGGGGDREGAGCVLALAVREVVGLRVVPADSLVRLPPLVGDAGQMPAAAMGVADGQVLLVLESARAVPDSVWAALSDVGDRGGPDVGIRSTAGDRVAVVR